MHHNIGKIGFTLLGCLLTVVSMSATIPKFLPFSAECDGITIHYVIPAGKTFLSGEPAATIRFTPRRAFPLDAGLFAVGWDFADKVPRIQLDLLIVKIGHLRFGADAPPNQWQRILGEEGVARAIPYQTKSCIVRDSQEREWVEMCVFRSGRLSSCSYSRPIAPDLLLISRLNILAGVAKLDKIESVEIQRKVVNGISVKASE